MYYKKQTIVYLNGQWIKASDAKVDLYAQTMHYGNGVFEGIRAYGTSRGAEIFKEKEHFQRLLYSANKMHINIDYSIDELIDIAYLLLEKNNLQDAYIRPLVYLGENMSLKPAENAYLFMCAWQWEKYLGNELLNVMTSSYQRPNSKSCHVEAKVVGHYTNSILATSEANQKGFDEALLLDCNSNVAEGPGANFFYENNGVLYTCPRGNILPGITRTTILELSKELNIKVVEEYFTPEDVRGADGAFFTGTAAEVAGIKSLDNVDFKLHWEDTIGYQLSRMYKHRVSSINHNHFDLV